jgi:pilus assembly protein FimV
MKRELPFTIALTLLAAGVAEALGLGPLERRSALNEPFEARIPLTGASAEDLDTLRISLAGADAFRRAGIERGLLATQLRFELVQPPTGQDYIRVSTRDPVGEPFVSFLIELNWAAGRLFREYTALLDPPGFQRQPLAVKAPEVAAARPAAPPRPATAPTRVAAGPAPAPPRREAPPEPGPRAAAEPFAAEVRVDKGDTLWGLAAPLARRAGVSTAQALVALWRANPDAFTGGNMNALRAGAILRLPDSSVLAGLSSAEALAAMAEQNELWQRYRGARAAAPTPAVAALPAAPAEPPREPAAPTAPAATPAPPAAATDPALRLLAPAPEDASRAGEAGLRKELDLTREEIESRAAENEELRARLDEAERLLARMERMLEVKSAELARLQERLGMPATPVPLPEDGAPAATPAPEGPAAAGRVETPVEPTAPPPEKVAAAAVTDHEAGIVAPDAAGAEAQEEASTGQPVVAAETETETETEADPLAILERDLAAAEEGADILAADVPVPEAPATVAVPVTPEPVTPEAAAPTEVPVDGVPIEPAAPVVAEGPAPPTTGDTDPAIEAAPAPAAPGPAPVAVAPPVTPPPAPSAPPDALQDALTRWAESVVPPAVSGAVPGGALSVLGGAGALILAGLGLLVARLGRRRPVPVSTASAGPAVDTEATLPASPASTLPKAPAVPAAPAARAVGLAPAPPVAAAFQPDATLTDVPLSERTLEATAVDLAGIAPVAPEVDDLLTEVNVYLAYEQYDQAETLVRRAIAESPRDPRRHQYLLDIFYAKGDAPAFEQAAATLRDLTGGTGPAWDDVIKRWQELAPGRELFAARPADEPFEVTAQRTFVDLTAADTRRPAPEAPVAGSRPPEADDPFATTATFAPGELTLAEIAGAAEATASPSPAAELLDLDLGGTGSDRATGIDPGFDAIAADEGGLDFADDHIPLAPAAAQAVTFDPTAGDDFTLVDITGGDAGAAAPAPELIDITSEAGSRALAGGPPPGAAVADPGRGPVAAEDAVLDITGGDAPAEPSTVRLSPVNGLADAGEATRGFDPSMQLLDITATGARPGRDLQELLDVSLEGAGLGDLLDVSGPAAGTPGALAGTVPDETHPGTAALDLPLEFDISGLSEAASPALQGEGGPAATLGVPALAARGEQPLSLAGDQDLGDTFDRPTSLDLGEDDGESLNDLAQALEETASRLRSASPVPDLADFSATRTDAAMPADAGAEAQTDVLPEFAELGTIDFDLLGGTAGPGTEGLALEDDALSLEDLEAALAAASGTAAEARTAADESDPGDLSSADSWLNLAHAYIEIGDPASAREELERVLAEGSPEQQAQARRLLDQIKD